MSALDPMAIRRSPATGGGRAASVGQDRLILTCSGAGAPELQSGKSARFCPDGDQAIAIYSGVVSGDCHLQGLSPARVNVGEGQALALRISVKVCR